MKKEKTAEVSAMPESVTGGNTETFEDVARQFTQPEAQPEQPEGSAEPPPKQRWWHRFFGAREAQKRESLVIKIEWARGALENCFLPLARLDHPAWALTPDESEKGAPTMQAFLQSLADKYAPAVFSRLSNRYPEFTDLALMLSWLYWQKWNAVSRQRALEAKQNHQGFENARNVTPTPPDGVRCEDCQQLFPDQAAALAHLPCPGARKN